MTFFKSHNKGFSSSARHSECRLLPKFEFVDFDCFLALEIHSKTILSPKVFEKYTVGKVLKSRIL